MALELLLQPDLGKKAYRLRCRFRVPAAPNDPWGKASWLHTVERTKFIAADRFVRDMAVRGYEHVDKFGFRMTGPYVAIDPSPHQRIKREPSAREMLAAVAQGARFLANETSGIQSVPLLGHAENWEYELAAVFVHKTILAEIPFPEEEQKEMRRR